MGERFVVIGAGTMGLGIAYVAAGARFDVELVEVDPGRSAAAHAKLTELWAAAVQRGRATAADAEAAGARIHSYASIDEIDDRPQVIVEAVPERADLKRSLLIAAEAKRPEMLASNTSSISIDSLAAPLRHPERFLGLHFFNPVWAMALLEIVVGAATDEPTRVAAVALSERLGKDPVVVRDMPGFATSRLGVALGLEAIRMVQDGVASPADIDKAMELGYRHPMGPLRLTDQVGLDVRLDIAKTLQAAYGDRFSPPELLEQMVAEGKLGRKTGEGFYQW